MTAVALRATDAPRDRCDEYVLGHPRGLSYHRPAWMDVIRRAFDHETQYLTAEAGRRIVGVLPLVWQKSLLFGNRLVSLPWFDSAGVLANSQAARDALIQAACEIANRCGASQLHLRQWEPFDESPPARTDKVLMRLALPVDSQSLWNSFSPKVRNQVRKAEKSGLTAQTGGGELLDRIRASQAI